MKSAKNAMSDLERLIKLGEVLLERAETLLPPASRPVDWKGSIAFRWRKTSRRGFIQPSSGPTVYVFQTYSAWTARRR